MENYRLVLPEHLNHYGFLFGGYLLKWIDENAGIAVSLDYPRCNFVTVALDKVEFKKSVKDGTILKFIVLKEKEGNTSIQYRVTVYRGGSAEDEKDLIFKTLVTFVHIDEEGKKKRLPR